MDKLHTIQVFIEVANQQSFVLASEKLGMSPPAVTRSVAALEHGVGAKLFNRTTRHVRLTESGALFLTDAKRILEELEEAEAAIKGVYTKPSGTLAITAPVLFGEKHIMPIVTEYLALNPDVSVKAMFHDRVTSLVEEELDVAIRIGHLKDSSLYATQVGQVRRVVCGSPDYFDQYGSPTHPQELKDHSIIFPTTFESVRHWPFKINGKRETIKLTPRLRCNQNSSSLRAAILGHGITRLMSYQVGEELASGTLQSVLTQYEEDPIPLNIIHLEGRRVNAKVRSFIDLAAMRLRSNNCINPSSSD